MKKPLFQFRILIFVAALLLSGCVDSPSDSSIQETQQPIVSIQPAYPDYQPSAQVAGPGQPVEATLPAEQPQTETADATPYSDDIQASIDSLAEYLSLPAGQIDVLEVEPVEWPDTSLGCPQPGMMYAQVITPGYRILLKAGEQTYSYHTGSTGQGVLCGDDGRPLLPSFPVKPGEIDDGIPWIPVD